MLADSWEVSGSTDRGLTQERISKVIPTAHLRGPLGWWTKDKKGSHWHLDLMVNDIMELLWRIGRGRG